MAVAYEAVASAGPAGKANGETLVITKPANTADGDLLIASFGIMTRSATTPQMSTLSGWTLISRTGTGNQRLNLFYKVASSEGADYTWQYTGEDDSGVAGAIYRISGAGNPTSIQSSVEEGTSPWAVTLTPTFHDSLALIITTANDGTADSTGSVSTYAITTNNPTWTERVDINADLDAYFGAGNPSEMLLAGATASRPEQTATGDASATIAAYNGGVLGALMIIPPVSSVTVSPSVISAVATVQDPTVTGGATVSPSVITATASVIAPTITTEATKWSNTTKNSETWTPVDKT